MKEKQQHRRRLTPVADTDHFSAVTVISETRLEQGSRVSRGSEKGAMEKMETG